MREWARAHRFLNASGAVLAVVAATIVFGDRGLPVLSGSVTSSPIPATALAPALTAAIVVSALASPWSELSVAFGRRVLVNKLLWVLGSSMVSGCLLYLTLTGESTFNGFDLLRNVAICTAAAVMGSRVFGTNWCWVGPLFLVIGAFAPDAGQSRQVWAVIVWDRAALGDALVVTGAACAITVACVRGTEDS